ncbi:GGDEF domain-containing protein [Azospirillum doebereinerae]|uniref:diguanylate cyclase n=1 Tax=Azospirillum doebereinerae TaxID=92933 RepID=A0A3S0V306_9PROT|nr:GGDEF domain-containing protein [Azospirillum doebereinerae]MCG5238542.1 GGDEF domain-containing protein [Azospirillum doebereinerae]RUQ74615.1 GGDEF domain-containing protein [Azospirillum doebereinerae]
MNLDTTFIAQMIAIIGFTVGGSVLLASVSYPNHIRRGLRSYAYGKLLVAAGFLIAASRGATLPEITVPAANGIVIAGLSLNYVCVRHLQQKPVPKGMVSGCGAVVAAFCALVLFVDPADLSNVRLVSSVAAVLLLGLVAAELLLFYEGRGIAHYMSGVLLFLMGLAFALRIWAAASQPASPVDQMINDGAERAVLLMSFLGTVVGSITFILMAGDAFNKELTILAHTDGLTGLLNRRRFLEIGENEFQRARRHGRPLTVLTIDIDRFKTINDRAGHPFGDRVIQAVAATCGTQIRREDAAGRLGGEEFAILLPETDEATGEQIAERLRTAIERDVAPLGAEHGLAVTCSVGGVSLGTGHQSFTDLIALSDAALYAAKNGGRNQVRFAGAAEPLPMVV